jgi:hypothetical protein
MISCLISIPSLLDVQGYLVYETSSIHITYYIYMHQLEGGVFRCVVYDLNYILLSKYLYRLGLLVLVPITTGFDCNVITWLLITLLRVISL